MTNIRGYVEQVTREGVRGWAYDADEPARLPLIEVLVDGRAVAVGTTDQPRIDFRHLGLSRDTLGFQVRLPDGMVADLAKMQVRVVGADQPLTILDDAGIYEGFVEHYANGMLQGWAWHNGYPDERVRIRVRHKGEIVGSAIANQLRPDLIGGGVGDGRHAYALTLPVIEKQLDPSEMFVEFEATGGPLTDLRYPGRPLPPPLPGQVAKPAPGPAAAARPPIAARPAPTPAPKPATRTPISAPAAMPRPISARPAAARPIAPRPIAQPAPAAPARPISAPPPVAQARAPVQASAPPPASQPAPQAAPPAPQPQFASPPQQPAISRELYEALRGSLHFGDEDGLF